MVYTITAIKPKIATVLSTPLIMVAKRGEAPARHRLRPRIPTRKPRRPKPRTPLTNQRQPFLERLSGARQISQ